MNMLQLLKKNVTERLGCGLDDATPIKVHHICLSVVILWLPFLRCYRLHYSHCQYTLKVKGIGNHAAQDSVGGAHLPLPSLQPVHGEPLML